MNKPIPAGARRRGTLEILGVPRAPVAVFALAHQPPSRIFDGNLPTSGRLRLRVPNGVAMRVLVGSREATVEFTAGTTKQCVDLRT